MTATHDASLALRADGLLSAFNRAGILTAADVHVARRLGAIGGETDDAVLLAAALVVRSTRHGSVVLDLATAEETTSPDVDDEADAPVVEVPLDWPGSDWVARCTASPLVDDGQRGGPLRMAGSRLWLARYWDQEEQVAAELLERSATQPDDLDAAAAGGRAGRGCSPARAMPTSARPRRTCALSRVSVLAGGPGHRQDDDREPAAGAAARAAPGLADPAGGTDRQGRRPARGGGPVVDGRRCQRRTSFASASCPPRRCTGCSAGDPRRAAGSGTTAPTGCRSRSSWSTRRRWCR